MNVQTHSNTAATGYTGSGYVDGLTVAGSAAQFGINVPDSNAYTATARYANSSGGTESVSVYVNGVKVEQELFPSLSGPNIWGVVSTPVVLGAGNNTIAFKVDSGDTGGIKLDNLAISAREPRTKVEAESGVLEGRAAVFSDSAASGGQAVQQLDTVGDGVQFNNAPAATQLSMTYATPNTGTYSVYVNGTKAASVPVGLIGAWSGKYLTSSYRITIPAGATVRLQHDSGDTGINLDYVTFSP